MEDGGTVGASAAIAPGDAGTFGSQTSRLLWYLVLRQTHARTLIGVVPLVCRGWRQTAKKVLSERHVPFVDPESVFSHCHVVLPDSAAQLLARLVFERRLTGSKKDEPVVDFALDLAVTEDVRVLEVKVVACKDSSQGNPRGPHTETKLRRVVSPWFSLTSCHEIKVTGSRAPELHAYFRLECASGLVVGQESVVRPPRFTALDCDTLSKECHLDTADAFRTLFRACLVVPLQHGLFPIVVL
jgi:hypothetical protein